MSARSLQGSWARQLALALVCLLPMLTHAVVRDHYFRNLDVRQGLAQGRVVAMLQDRQGFIWIATSNRLQRYDGYRFQDLEDLLQPGELPSPALALAEDDAGRIWIGTARDGLYLLDPRAHTLTAHAGPDAALGRRIEALLHQPGVGLWVGSPDGVGLLSADSGRYQQVLTNTHDSALPAVGSHRRSVVMALDPGGFVWVGSGRGLLRIDSRDRSQRTISEMRTNALSTTAGGKVWIGAEGGLYHLNDDATALLRIWPLALPESGSLACCDVRALAAVEDGSVWLAVHEGNVWRFDPDHGRARMMASNPWIEGMLVEQDVVSMMIDRSQLLWMGGGSRGVSTTSVSGAPFRAVFDLEPSHDALAGNFIQAIAEADDGRLWLGTQAGLHSYDPSRNQFAVHSRLLGGDGHGVSLSVRAIERANGDALWLATQVGLFHYEADGDRFQAIDLAGVDEPLPLDAMARLRDGTLWLAVTGRGLLQYQPVSRTVQTVEPQPGVEGALQQAHITVITEDSRGRVWLGGPEGLSLFNPANERFHHFTHDQGAPDSLSGSTVQAIHESRDGMIWIGTDQGLDQVIEEADGRIHFRSRKISVESISLSIMSIIEDREGHLWLSGNAGLIRLDRSDGSLARFGPDDGLQDLRFNPGAAALLGNGQLAFGGVRGFNITDPTRTLPSSFQPPIAISTIAHGHDRAIPMLEAPAEIRMPAQQRLLSIRFAALDYTAPDNNLFSHLLEGFDKQFSTPDHNPWVILTNLKPGHYLLRVRAANHSGVWSPEELRLPIHILPPLWQSWPARLAYLLALALAVIGLWWAQQLRIRRRDELLVQIREREERLALSLWGSGDTFWDVDFRTQRFRRIGDLRTRGDVPPQEMSFDDWRHKVVHPEDAVLAEQRLWAHAEGRTEVYESDHRIRTSDGDWLWIRARGKVVERDAQSRPLRMAGTARDISASRAAERERRIASEVLRSMNEAVAVLDLNFRFASVNPAFLHITGYREQDVLGMPDNLLQSSRHPQDFFRQMHEALLRDGQYHGEMWLHRYDGEEFLGWVEINQVGDEAGQRSHYVAVLNDITEKKRTEQELRYLANYDTLTGLPNRSLLSERLARGVVRARRSGNKLALLFLDLDHFKVLNDSFGHATGDRILKATAARLLGVVGTSDTVARLGGDEFTILMEDVLDADAVVAMAQAVITAFQTAVMIEADNEVVVSPSIGISLYPDHAQVPVDLLKAADAAMYRAKDRGRNTFQFYDQSMEQEMRQRASMTSALRRALERNELHLAFQPRQALVDGRIVGVEALLRWDSEEFGSVPPSTFIPLAEETGLIFSLGEWVMRTACEALASWTANGIEDTSVAVNVSVLQLLRGNLPEAVAQALAESGLPADRLELEITESVAMANAEQTIKVLNELKRLGTRIVIDDFGTGYSSLIYLKRLPIDTLKIDREFVDDLTRDPDDEAIVTTIISMAHSLGLNVVAEGVETTAQLQYLQARGCDEIQGFLLARPMRDADCFAFLQRHAGSPSVSAPA